MKVIHALIVLLMAVIPLFSEEKGVVVDYELDPYYSNVGLFISLTDIPIPDVGEMGELELYRHLFLNLCKPRFLLVEASINPMPLMGVFVKENYRSFYEDAQISPTFNAVRAISAGFDEPWALSIFLGNVVTFREVGKKEQSKNKGYGGFLTSIGNYHIKNNEMIRDDWVEIEWKVKGDRKFSDHDLSYSYRIGAKFHDHPEIRNVYRFSIRRSKLDFNADWSDWINNSGMEYTIDLATTNLSPLRHYFIIDKKIPFKVAKAGLSLAVGLLWESPDRYKGSLQESTRPQTTFILRPNLVF